MAFLEINGWAVDVQIRAFSDARDDVESRARQYDGSLFLDIRTQGSAYNISTTGIVDEATRDALRRVVQGDGEHWSFDVGPYGSRGTGISFGVFSVPVGGGKFGSYLNVTGPVATFPTAFGVGAVWTVAYWRDEGVLDWHSIIVTSDGRKWRDAVRNDAEPTPELFVTVAGNIDLLTGGYDDLVALPHLILDVQGDTWPQAVAYSELPRLLATGDAIPDAPQEVLGEWNQSGDIPIADAVASYRGAFLLRTTGGTFRSSPEADVDPTATSAIQAGVETDTFPESAWVHSGIGTLTFVSGQPVLTIAAGLTGTATATFVNTGVFEFGTFRKIVGRVAQSMASPNILDMVRIVAQDPDEPLMFVFAASKWDGASWDSSLEHSSPNFSESLDTAYISPGGGEDVMVCTISAVGALNQKATTPWFDVFVSRPNTLSASGGVGPRNAPDHANWKADFGTGPTYEYLFELVANGVHAGPISAALEFLQIDSVDLRTSPVRLILHLDDTSAMYQDSAGNVLAVSALDPVALWQDISGAGNHAQNAGFVDSDLDLASMAVRSVNFVSTHLEVIDAASFSPRPGRGFEVHTVVQTTDAGTNHGPIGKWGSVPSEWALWSRYFQAPFSSASSVDDFNAPDPDTGGTFQVNDGLPHILAFRITGGGSPLVHTSVDGVDISAGVAVPSLAGDRDAAISIGRYQFSNAVTQYVGLLAQAKVWDGVLSTAARAAEIAATKAKFGIP